MERWKVIAECPEFEVSSEGRVRSLQRTVMRAARGKKTQHPFIVGGHVLKASVKKTARRSVALRVTLCGSRIKLYRYVHRLVLNAFIGPAPQGFEACHSDGNPFNNALSNLRWDTHLANYRDSVRHGTNVPPPIHRGEAHPKAALSDAVVADLRKRGAAKGEYSRLGREYGVSPQTIRRIVLGRTRV